VVQHRDGPRLAGERVLDRELGVLHGLGAFARHKHLLGVAADGCLRVQRAVVARARLIWTVVRERRAVAEVGQQQHWRPRKKRFEDTHAGVGQHKRALAHRHARLARQPAVHVGHDRRQAFLANQDDPSRVAVVVQRDEDRLRYELGIPTRAPPKYWQNGPMRISNVRVLLLSAPIPPERRWTSDFGTNTKQDIAVVIVETDAGLVGYGEAKGTPVVMKVLVEDVLGPQIIGEDPTRVEFVWEKLYSGSRLPLALQHGRPYHRAGSRGDTIHAISGIDVALWDIYGKSLGLPIYRLLGGGVRDRLPAYASGGWAAPEQTVDEVLG
jgi:Mandelate racemase / muconate lactonizing enzyme, N-terminal domain